MLRSFLNGRVEVAVGDITLEDVDAIVNAANSSLLGGGGVDGAIHSRGGPAILDECRKIRQTTYPDGLPTGQAVITTGGDLIARHVIHTVGPIYGSNNGRDAELLANCYANSLAVAVDNDLATIAFPSISTGVYGYPKPEAAGVASRTVYEFLTGDQTIERVRMIFFSDEHARVFLDNCVFNS